MSMETWYAGGSGVSGVLVRSGRHLLLLGAEPTTDLLQRCWDVVTGEDQGDVPGRLLALVDSELPHSPLVLLDLTPGSRQQVVRGGADVFEDGTTRRARLDPAATPGPWLPIAGGVVAAAAVEVRWPAAARPETGIIDGIPPALLAELAEGPTADPPRPTLTSETFVRPPLEEPRTVRRAPYSPVGPVGPVGPPPAATGDTVLAALCPLGHVTSAVAPLCRVCGATVPDQPPRRIPRPGLGALRLPSGERVPLDRGAVIGRRPTALGDEPALPHLVHLPADSPFVSRLHVSIELDGWLVVARDLGSRGGTFWKVPGRAAERMRANEPYLLEPGQALDLAGGYEIVYEATA